ncbi:unnamed protein product [Anisakis simplex]|uniref:G-protein coupled receptor (inferred by orthology to a C. elegans protein) n=1 Tax=Anisakis simplex TaxID=6269 RepID=A0A0M3K0G3_ANISI|nr:unnamed protein product [Anisakis simplex]
MHRQLNELNVVPKLPQQFQMITNQCCNAASYCCDTVLSQDNPNQIQGTSCAATWDGWQCFRRTSPGPLAARCPNYIFGDKILEEITDDNFAIKTCNIDGQWLTVNRPSGKAEWTDYSGCLTQKVHFSLYSQAMFRIHRQLLLSLLMSALFYLFNCFFFVIDGAPGYTLYLSNHITCRLLFTVQLRYLRLATSTWMFAEGVYLYRILVNAFAEPESLRAYFIVCWGFPTLATAMYSVFRQFTDNNQMCWVSPSENFSIESIIIGPCLLALCGNFILMSGIMYVLVKKLKYNPHMEPAQYRKAVRAVFMLVPVFGLHFLFTIYRLSSYTHQIINLFLDGIQGFVVAVILCYANGHVQECVHKTVVKKLDNRNLKKLHFERRGRFNKERQSSDNHQADNSVTVSFIQQATSQHS